MKNYFIITAVASYLLPSAAFTTVPYARPPPLSVKPFTTASSQSSTAVATPDTEIAEAKALLSRAAETKLENPDKVLDALNCLEKNCKEKFKENPSAFSKDILENISGEWRLIFTTGTKERQQKSGGRVNYFPLKAIQKFDATTQPKLIENGIYAWDLPLLRFSGDWVFDERKQELEFDFDLIELFGLIKIKLGRKDVAKIGASTGLGSKGSKKLANLGRRVLFYWIGVMMRLLLQGVGVVALQYGRGWAKRGLLCANYSWKL